MYVNQPLACAFLLLSFHSSTFLQQKSQVSLIDLAVIVSEKNLHLATFLRWHDPDQVQGLKKLLFSLSPTLGHP